MLFCDTPEMYEKGPSICICKNSRVQFYLLPTFEVSNAPIVDILVKTGVDR